MAKFKGIKLNKVKNLLVKFLRALAEHSFLTFLALFIISIGIGALIFVQFNTLVESPTEVVIGQKPLKIEDKTYQKIKEEWDKRSIIFSETVPKEYTNPFLH